MSDGRKAIQVVGALALVLGGVGLGMISAPPAATPTPDSPTQGDLAPGPVHVSIVYEESGEARSVSLTDSEGLDVPVGSVAEEWPWLDDNTDEES